MIAGDFTVRKNYVGGKFVEEKIICSENGTEYALGKKLGKGGVAKVFRARRLSDNMEFAFKEYVPSKDPIIKRQHIAIQGNLRELIRNPLKEANGTALKFFVPPLEMVTLNASKGFGYIMKLVDTKDCYEQKKLWHADRYPDAKVLCVIGKNISHVFRRIHLGRGFCYKDINEGNIYINPQTGDIHIIDCDNINVPKVKTIIGTSGYIAPEIYVSKMPDNRSDNFSLATYFYRLMVGGYPMDGKRTLKYLLDNELSVQEAGPEIYGKMALFAFDPVNKANEIRSLTDPKYKGLYEAQTKRWDAIPQPLKDCFIQTFSTSISNEKRATRTSDQKWYDTFDELEKNGLVKCKCGKYAFAGQKTCKYCDKDLPKPKPIVKPVDKKTTPVTKPTPTAPTVTVPKELTKVVFGVARDVTPAKLKVTVERKIGIPGSKLHPNLPSSNFMRIEYSKKLNKLSAVNTSSLTWRVESGKKPICKPNERVVLEKGMVIHVLPASKLYMKVLNLL